MLPIYYIVKCKYILKMFQIITTFDEVFNHIWVDCTISISYEKFHSCDFTKKIWMRFFNQISIILLKKICWKLIFIPKILTRIMLETFISKSILHMFIKTLDEIQKTLPLKQYKMYFKKYIFLLKMAMF